MSFYAWNFACSPAVGYNDPLSVENLAMARLLLGNMSIRDSGILYWTDSSYVAQVGSLSNPFDGLFEPSDAGGGIVTIQSGAAIVNGYLFISDDTENFDINSSPGNANATDRIVLRWTAATQTVALIRVNGPARNTAPLTQTSTVWDTPIARVELDGSGDFAALIDDRRLAMPTGTVVKLGEQEGDGTTGTITFDNIPPVFSKLRIEGVVRAHNTSVGFVMTLNNDGGANYDRSTINGINAAVAHSRVIGSTSYSVTISNIANANSPANAVDPFTVELENYKSTSLKTIRSTIGNIGDGTNGGAGIASNIGSGLYNSTSPVTRVDFILSGTGNFTDLSKIILYGVI